MLTNETTLAGDRDAQSAQRPNLSIVRPSDRAAVSTLGGAMADPNSQGGQWLAIALPTLSKLVPAGLGAAIMIAVDPPQNKRELFLRILVAFALSYMFTGVVIDFLHQFAWFSFLDRTKPEHRIPVEFLLGACGWSILGGIAMALKRFRQDPESALHAAGEAKRELL